MDPNVNPDGQPLNQAFNWDRRLDRGMDELIGMVRGVLADGVLVEEEARFLLDWLNRNEPVRRDFFGKQLYNALSKALEDGVIDAEEEDALVDILLRFIGKRPSESVQENGSTLLPLDDPPPKIIFAGCGFCFTGKFVSGKRSDCQKRVISLGAVIHKYPTYLTDYLVIGEIGSRDWIHSNSGRKIERAIEIRSAGRAIKIISEQYWTSCLGSI